MWIELEGCVVSHYSSKALVERGRRRDGQLETFVSDRATKFRLKLARAHLRVLRSRLASIPSMDQPEDVVPYGKFLAGPDDELAIWDRTLRGKRTTNGRYPVKPFNSETPISIKVHFLRKSSRRLYEIMNSIPSSELPNEVGRCVPILEEWCTAISYWHHDLNPW